MKRLILVLIVAALVIAGLGFVAGPWLSFRALRAAALANDTQGIGEVVDYNAVRSALRQQLVGGPVKAPPPSLWQDPVGAIGRFFGDAPKAATVNVDSYLTPSALAQLSNAQADKEPKPKDAAFMAGDIIPGLHGSEIRFWDPKRSQVAVREADGREVIFTFERRSLMQWKLVHLRLPDDVAA